MLAISVICNLLVGAAERGMTTALPATRCGGETSSKAKSALLLSAIVHVERREMHRRLGDVGTELS
jgi:hypothetical protein